VIIAGREAGFVVGVLRREPLGAGLAERLMAGVVEDGHGWALGRRDE
jgi:hypothetical protein